MRLYLALGHVLLQNRQASARPEANAALTKALELAEIADDGRYRLAALHGLYLARFFTGEYRNALNLARSFAPLQRTRRLGPMCRSATYSSVLHYMFWETSPVRDDISSHWLARTS